MICQTEGDPERFQHPGASDSQHHLLAKSHRTSPYVEGVGDGSIRHIILGDVGVEEQQRHPADVELPNRHLHLPAGKLDLDFELATGGRLHWSHRQPAHIEGGIDVLLITTRLDLLAEVAAPVEQADRDQGQPEVRG